MKEKLKKMLFVAIVLTGSAIFAQQTVTGTVSDADGPLPGASVVVNGTSNGTTTDFDGNYSLDNVALDAVLTISYLGYATQEMSVDGRSVVNVTLLEDTDALDEVIVTGYLTQTRGDITGSISSVDMAEAIKMPVVNAAELLQGRVSGVTVIANAQPGQAPNISIRGLGTTNATGPLFIIDGVQTTDPDIFNSINPADIDQMNVLKDGAAAIYGARAANGVLIVTTKNGGYNMGKTQVSFDINTGIAVAVDGQDMLNAQQHGQMLWDGLANDGAALTHPQYGSGPTPVVPGFLQGTDRNNNPVPSARVDPNGTDWFDEITRVAPTTNVSFSLANGDENSKSYLSLGFLNRDGVIKNNGFKRVNIQSNNEYKVFDKLTIGQHLNVAYSQYKGNPSTASELAIRISPLVPVFADNGDFAGTYSNSNGLSVAQNPVARLFRNRNDYDNSLRIFGDVYLSYEILEGLTFKTTFGGSLLNRDTRDFTALNPEFAEAVTVNVLAEEDINSYSWIWTNMVNYSKAFGEHNINAIAAVEAIENGGKSKGVSRADFFDESPDFYLLSTGFGDPNIDYANENKNTLFSVFGSADYNFKQKYFLTGTLRYDKSSRFSGDNKSDIFPSFSAGWVINKEDFYSDDALVSRLKLKGSWGELGNQELPINNPTLSLFNFNQDNANYVFNQGSVSSGASLSQIGTPDLKWEVSETINIGLEMGMFDNKLNASFELWQINTNGLIVRDNQTISTTAPDASAPFVNIGNVKNTGFDLDLSYGNTTNGGFSYNISANVSHYKNEVVKLIDGTPVPGRNITSWAGAYTRTEEGEPMSYFFGRIVDGFDADGRWTYKDVDGDGDVDDDDRTKIGSPHPDFTYGINLSGEYKGFDFSMFFNGSQGNDIYNHNKIFTDFPLFVNNNRSTRVLDSWTPTNTNATLPALSNSLNGVEINSNSYFVEDGSFFRLRNLQLGYSFPKNLTDKLNMGQFRVFVQGTNLFTITGYQGLDPEVRPVTTDDIQFDNLNMGIDLRTFPLSKIYTIGLNVKF